MKKIRQVLDEILILPAKSKLGIAGLLLLTLIFAFFATLLYWRIKVPRPSAPKKEIPFVKKEPNLASLTLVPESRTLNVGDSFLVTIHLKTGDFKDDTVDAVLNYDPKILAVEDLSEGMFFAESPIKRWKDGKIFLTGTIGASEKQIGGAKGEGAIGTISFRALASGSTSVDFDQSSIVATKGENVLGEVRGARFEIY